MSLMLNWLLNPAHDRIVAQAIGLVLSGALVLLWVGLRLTEKGA